jgi:thiamine thiazole synthase
LDEIDVTYHRTEDGIFVADGPHACSKLIASACDAGAKILNMTSFEDVVINNGRVVGAVINWTPVQALPRAITCVDPIALESEIVIDATGHDAVVARSLEKRALIETKGFGAMNVDESERALIEMTGEIFPGLILTGMSVATAYGLPRMGPTFCGVLCSGKKAAQVSIDSLSKATRRMTIESTSTI